MLPNITLSGVTFELENGRTLFHDLTFSLEPKLTALVGPNGIGKSTLAKLIAGDLHPIRGSIKRSDNIVVFSQAEAPPDIPVYEYLVDYTWSLLGDKLLEGIDLEMMCGTLSGGQWMRVRLAHILSESFIILDEPTNNLDREARQILLDFLRHYQYGVLLISHDRECLRLCEDILELSPQGISKYGGGWEAYEKEKEEERERLQKNLIHAKKERDSAQAERTTQLERQEKKNREGKKKALKGGIPRILLGGMKRRAEVTSGKIDSSTIESINAKVREAHEAFQELKVDPVMYADLIGKEIPNQKLVAEALDFNIKFQDWIYSEDLNFSWRGNVRIAIKGKNGSGKSTLIKAILGDEFTTRGEIKRGDLKTVYLDQRTSSLEDSKSIFENVRAVSDLPDVEVRNGLARFLFFGDSVFQKAETLSGGERLRAALAQGLLHSERPELLIMDEPTNNLDLANIQFLEELVSQFKGALLMISHDEIFLENCKIEDELMI